MSHQHFEQLIKQERPVGEIRAVDGYLVTVYGMQPAYIGSVVMFEDGSTGLLQEIYEQSCLILHFGAVQLRVGQTCVLQSHQLSVNVGEGLLGRVVNCQGEPLDGLGPIQSTKSVNIMSQAVAMFDRTQLDTILPTGITAVDSMFPIVYGQRMALLGNSKNGKSTIATQIALNQKDTNNVVVYVLVAKKQTDVESLISRLKKENALSRCVVVVSEVSESLVMSYLAPYVGCAIAEYFWVDQASDTIVIYDDLSSHAYAHREISLLSKTTPGRESFPGDMFFKHASLLERCGKLNSSGKSLTAIAVAQLATGDISSYLPTNIMSITDGQWILDEKKFISGIRPAISFGLSVSRVGGRGMNLFQKANTLRINKALSSYDRAVAYSHFASELALDTKKDIILGERLQEIFGQSINERYTLTEQQIMLEVILSSSTESIIDISNIKDNVREISATVTDQASYEQAISNLRIKATIEDRSEHND